MAVGVKIRNAWREFRHNFGLPQVLVIVLVTIGGWWLLTAVDLMQKNYEQQIAYKEAMQRATLLGLENEEQEYLLNYHKTAEYQELRLREQGLVLPGEKVLLLPLNEGEKPRDLTADDQPTPTSHYDEWRRFFGL